jgi:hypothetical protein
VCIPCGASSGAWDAHAEDGPIVWLQLLDGYWGAMRENGDIDEKEAVHFRRKWW